MGNGKYADSKNWLVCLANWNSRDCRSSFFSSSQEAAVEMDTSVSQIMRSSSKQTSESGLIHLYPFFVRSRSGFPGNGSSYSVMYVTYVSVVYYENILDMVLPSTTQSVQVVG